MYSSIYPLSKMWLWLWALGFWGPCGTASVLLQLRQLTTVKMWNCNVHCMENTQRGAASHLQADAGTWSDRHLCSPLSVLGWEPHQVAAVCLRSGMSWGFPDKINEDIKCTRDIMSSPQGIMVIWRDRTMCSLWRRLFKTMHRKEALGNVRDSSSLSVYPEACVAVAFPVWP